MTESQKLAQKRARERAEVMLAFAEGKTIQCLGRYLKGDTWDDAAHPSWNWTDFDYRIKREPRVTWVNDYGSCLGGGRYATRESAKSAYEKWTGRHLWSSPKQIKFIEVLE